MRIDVEGRKGQVIVQGTRLTPDEALDLADRIVETAVDEGTMFGGMGPDAQGGWTVNAQPSPGLTRRMVRFLCEWLGPAENYTETRLRLPFDLPGGAEQVQVSPKPAGQVKPYVLTVQRAGGKTPHEKRIEAEDALGDLRERLDRLRVSLVERRDELAELRAQTQACGDDTTAAEMAALGDELLVALIRLDEITGGEQRG